jgi:hypothetical protein
LSRLRDYRAVARITNAKLAAGITDVSGAARRADLRELTVRVVVGEDDPYADRRVVTAPELEVVVKRSCCTLTLRMPIGDAVWGQRLACPHQAGG